MRLLFIFLGLIGKILTVHRVDSLPINAGKNGGPGNGKSCDKAVVCNCNYNVKVHSHVSGDIRELKTKMEQLIALMNKTSPSTPPPTTLPG